MSKKKAEMKALQKRISTIVEIYRKQKGRQNRNQLASFIEEKICEIIIYKDVVGKQGKRESNNTATEVPANTQKLEPSAELLEELQNKKNNNGQVLQEV